MNNTSDALSLDNIDFGSIAQHKNTILLDNSAFTQKEKQGLVQITNNLDSITKD